jgi:hypothetical protein
MRFIQPFILGIFLFTPLLSFGVTGHCAKIKDSDKRYLCTAVGMNNMTVCNEMSTKDGANHCKAMTVGSSGYCEKVNLGNRAQCLIDLSKQQRKSMWSAS